MTSIDISGGSVRRKNKILLIYPKFHKVDFDAKSYPLGLLAIGTILKNKGYQVKIIDFLVEESPNELFKRELSPEILAVGLSVMTPQIPGALKISRAVKDYSQDIPIVWGGIHPTLFPEQTVINSLVDFVVSGEGEISFPRLLDYFAGQERLENIKGIVYYRQEKFFSQLPGEVIEPETLPILDHSLLSPKTREFDSVILNTSRGCPYRCAFCVNLALNNRRWRAQSAEKILAGLDYLVNRLGYRKVKFQEDNFFVDKKRVIGLIEGIKQRGLKFQWFTNCRVDYFRENFIDGSFLEKLKESGCYKLNFGAESGSQRVLDFLKKDISVEQIIASAELCQRYGIRANYSFMTALPSETKEERMKTLKLIDRLMAVGPLIEIISPQPYRPYPGDELSRECRRRGYHFPERLEDWPAVVAKSLDSSSSNLEDFPWVARPNEIRLQRVCSIIAASRKRLSDYLGRYPKYLAPFIALFYWLEKFRWRRKNFSWPLEYSLFINLYWKTQKLRKKIFIK